jgi:hypothetical protein
VRSACDDSAAPHARDAGVVFPLNNKKRLPHEVHWEKGEKGFSVLESSVILQGVPWENGGKWNANMGVFASRNELNRKE